MSDNKRTVELVYAQTGQTVETYPDEWAEGIPSSASCSVFRGDRSMDDTAEFSPSVTVDSTSIQVDQASGYSQTNRRRLYLASTSGLVIGRPYRLQNAGSQCERVVPAAIVTDDYVDLEDELCYDYAAASTSLLKGIRLSFTVDATWIATEEKINVTARPNYKVVWTYTVNSIVRRQYTYIRVVRQLLKHGVTMRDLEAYYPDIEFNEPMGQRGEAFQREIEGAFDAVRVDIKLAGYEPTIIRDTEIMHQIVLLRVLKGLAQRGLTPGGFDAVQWLQTRSDEYSRVLTGAIAAALRVDVDQGSEGNVTRPAIEQLWFIR